MAGLRRALQHRTELCNATEEVHNKHYGFPHVPSDRYHAETLGDIEWESTTTAAFPAPPSRNAGSVAAGSASVGASMSWQQIHVPSTSTICRSTQCTLIERWLERLLAVQTDPCETTHRFVCSEDAHYPGKQYSYLEVPPKSQIIKEASKHTSEAQAVNQNAGDRNSSFDLCLQYARDAHSGAQDISQFLTSVGLDLGSINEDPSYDILSRMLELSLEFGLDLPVSFVRTFNVTADASKVLMLQIDLHADIRDFLASWSAVGKEEWRKFYIFCLQSYTSIAPGVGIEEIVKDVIEEDQKGANVLNMTWNSKTFTRMTVANLSQRTGVESDRWIKLLALHGRLDLLPEDTVTATELALLLLHRLATHLRQRVAHRFVAWHLLRHFVAVKENVLRAFNTGSKDAGYAQSSTVKCQKIIEGLNDGPIVAVQLLTGRRAPSTHILQEVMKFLNHVQSTLASVFHQSQGSHDRKPPNLSASRLSSQSFDPDRRYIDDMFRGLRVVKQPFLWYWLLVLRSWNALPPLMQAHLRLVVASGVPVNTVTSYFEPPYYYDDGIAAYNFAALGQVISEALAVKLVEEFSRNAFFRDRWQHFWARNHVTGYSAAYCLHNTSNTMHRQSLQKESMRESALRRGDYEAHVIGTKLAYLSFVRTPLNESATLPRVKLSAKQLFFVIHCALSCIVWQSKSHHHCTVALRTPVRFLEKPCGPPPKPMGLASRCQYV